MEMHIKPVTYKVTLRLTNEMLGTVPKDRDIYKRFVAGRAEKELSGELLEEELASLNIPEGGVAERGWTGFRYVDDAPCIVNYMIKGMFKEICKTLRKVKGSHSSKLKAYRQAISTRVHVNPRYIPLLLPWDKKMGVCARPLRANTPQGERISLVCSDTVPAGTELTFTVEMWGDDLTEELLQEWLLYASRYGLGQWRSSGYGTVTLVEFQAVA